MLIAALNTLSELVPYVALFAAGFLVAAWGQSAKVPLAVAIGILIIVAAVALFHIEVSDFSDSSSPF